MLGGVPPLLIFNFYPTIGKGGALFDWLSTKTGALGALAIKKTGGIPIPIPLDEGVTGIYVENETKAIDIDTEIVAKYAKDGTVLESLTNQTGLNNLITINMIASRDSLVLSVLLALNDMVFAKVVDGNYSVTYMNRSTVLFGGLLHSFSTQAGSDDTLLKISMAIQKPNENKTTPTNLYYTFPKAATGTIPVVGAAS